MINPFLIPFKSRLCRGRHCWSLTKALALYKDAFITIVLPLLFLPIISINGQNDIGDPECCNPAKSESCDMDEICEYDSGKVARFGYPRMPNYDTKSFQKNPKKVS